MPEIKTLIHLIKSLSKAEKKNFSMLLIKQSDKDYLRLYKKISAFSGTSVMLEKECRKQFPGSGFNATVNYLYEVVIKSLIMLNSQSGTEEKLITGIQEIKLLFRKGLPDEGFWKLDKLLQLANKFEKFDYCIVIEKLKLEYLNRYHFQNLSEEELLKIQTQLRKHIQYELNLTEHASLCALLNFRFLIYGRVRSVKDKDKLNDLVFTEINLAGNPKFQSFNLKKNHLLFQSVYFMMTGDNKSSLITFYELNQLFENHRQLWVDSPLYYIQHIKGILNNLHLTGQYFEMAFFIEKLEELMKTQQTPMLKKVIFVSEIKKLLGSKNYAAAEKLVKEQSETVLQFTDLNTDDKSEILLYTAIVFFLKKEFKSAARLLREPINLEYLQNKQTFRMIKIVDLIIHLELQDFGYLNSGIRSLERDLKKSNKNFLTENVILKLLKKYPQTLSLTARNALFQTAANELKNLKVDPYEQQFLHVFDVEEWIENKVKHRNG